MADDTASNDYVSQFFNMANAFAPVFVKALAADKTQKKPTQAVADSTLTEIVNNSRLNGSGPANPNLALESAPTSIADFISGKNVGDKGGSMQTKPSMLPWILAGLGLLLILMVYKRH